MRTSKRWFVSCCLLFLGIVVVLFLQLWVSSLSHPAGLDGQLLFLFIGLLLAGPMIASGGALMWGNNTLISFALLVSGIDYLAIVFVYGWAVSDILFLLCGIAALGGSYRYWNQAVKK